MRRLYKTFLPSLILLSFSSSYSYAENIKNFKLEPEILESGDISLTSSINKPNNACIYLSYVQVLRNYESAVATDIDGTPILSRWETIWENPIINKVGTSTPSINITKAKQLCNKTVSSNNSFYSNFFRSLVTSSKSKSPNSDSSFQGSQMVLKQGEQYLANQELNKSAEYGDAELKVSAIYVKSGRVALVGSNSGNRGLHKVSTKVINLGETKDSEELNAEHKFNYPGFIQGKDMPLAYVASGNNLGCLGRLVSSTESSTSRPGANENPALMQNSRNNNSPRFDCYYATRANQKANEIPTQVLKERSAKDVLIMCPGSTIPNELSYRVFKNQQLDIPTSSSSPYLQVMSEGNNKWCNYIEKASRKWTSLHSVSNEGWMVSLNKRTNKLECLANNGECANALVDNSKLNTVTHSPSKLVKTPVLVLSGQSTRTCQYKDGSSTDCPEEFNASEINQVNDLLQTLQDDAMRSPIR